MSLRRLGFAAALIAGLGLFTAALLELGVRIFQPQVLPQDVPELWVPDDALRWKHLTNARVLANTGERPVDVCTDAEGDRVDCDAPARTDCKAHVLAMGDSFVEALAVPFRETVWQQLDADTGACTSVAGVGGYYLSQYVAATRARLAAPGAHFDLVILTLFISNDVTDDAERLPRTQEVQRQPLRLLPAALTLKGLYDWFYPFNSWLESHSQAYVALRFQIRRIQDPGAIGLFGVPPPLLKSRISLGEFEETARGVGLLAKDARAHGARVLVVVVPDRIQVLDPDAARLKHALPELADDIDMDLTTRAFVPRLEAIPDVDVVVDLLPELRASPDVSSLWGERDPHLSPTGHARWFEVMREPVRALLAAPPLR